MLILLSCGYVQLARWEFHTRHALLMSPISEEPRIRPSVSRTVHALPMQKGPLHRTMYSSEARPDKAGIGACETLSLLMNDVR